jgi:methanogenic corrinoid protein MtbC1
MKGGECFMGDIAALLGQLKEQELIETLSQKLDRNEDPLDLVNDLSDGMVEVGNKYNDGDYYLTELIFSAAIFNRAMEFIEPHLSSGTGTEKIGNMVIGTVAGDLHDIGKNLVIKMLQISGFEVLDLGIDVPAEKFVEALKETKAPILGMSALITPSFVHMKQVVEAVAEAGLRNRVKIIIGGGIMTKQTMDFVGSDAYTTDCMEGVAICKDFLDSRG